MSSTTHTPTATRTRASGTGLLLLAFVALCRPGAVRADSIATTDAFLPVARIVGANGTYRTDLWIFNPETGKRAQVDLYFTPAGEDGSNIEGKRINPDLYERETVAIRDVLSSVFGQTSSYGVLEVRSSVPVIVTSNTYNLVNPSTGATYGQFSPGQPYRAALGYDDSVAGDLYLVGLPNDSDHVTNAVIINPSGVTLEAGISLRDSVDRPFGTRIYTVKPYSMLQVNDIFGREFASFNPPPSTAQTPNPYRLTVFVNLKNDAKVLTYATVTDKRTGDPYLITGQPWRP